MFTGPRGESLAREGQDTYSIIFTSSRCMVLMCGAVPVQMVVLVEAIHLKVERSNCTRMPVVEMIRSEVILTTHPNK